MRKWTGKGEGDFESRLLEVTVKISPLKGLGGSVLTHGKDPRRGREV